LVLYKSQLLPLGDTNGNKSGHLPTLNLVLFANPEAMVLSHEVLHGMGLHHTHIDDEVIEESTRRYVYKENTTDNVMSYASTRKSTWYWQWKIVRKE